MQIYMYVHTREWDSRPGFDGVKIKLLLLLYTNSQYISSEFNFLTLYIYIYICIYYVLIVSTSADFERM